ncbi:hypothetical protein DPMN_099003 [Dreissena polymorpha]|uniref:Uncharacterized protein n=1 Tax=Dreissena polymorpha TaxID=45954 RepID=A0A9D4LD92_DREPO|nr:hypothetical protein DPMN_099003 [Dreissena polymorpha]
MKTHVLTKFQEDWTKNVTSRVFICFHCKHIEKTAPPPGDINETNVLTKFHDYWAKIVTLRVFTRNTAPPDVMAIGNSWKNFTLGGGVCRRVRYKENLYCLAI